MESSYKFTVEHGVPMPPAGYGVAKPPGHGLPCYPFPLMRVHDSFFVEETGDVPVRQLLYRVACAARGYATRHECDDSDRTMGFACRMVEGGVRVWRVR